MTIPFKDLLIGYDYDAWYGYNKKIPVSIDVTMKNNSHTLICGMSGSGKSYYINQYLSRLCLQGGRDSVVYFADFKQDDSFSHLRETTYYYAYDRTVEALDIVYDIMHKRQCGDPSRTFVTLIWDEYIANILFIQGKDKKKAEAVMHKVSEILMLGRSLAVRLIIACQRADVEGGFPRGSRLNFGVIIILGARIESIYSMLMPKEMIEKAGNREFHTGEGIMLWQVSELRFIKIPVIRNEEKMKKICVEALTR